MKPSERTLFVPDGHHLCQAQGKKKGDVRDKRYECSGRDNGDPGDEKLR